MAKSSRLVALLCAAVALCIPAASGIAAPPRTILFFGDSLTAGFGLDDASRDSFPAIVQAKIKERGLSDLVLNAGLSGDTSAGGLRRIDWTLAHTKPDVLVLELGANDGLRGIPLEETRRNLQGIIDKVRAKNPAAQVVVAGMKIPPNLGTTYVEEFERIFPVLARDNRATLIPFLLEGVAGDAALNQRDGIHPTAAGERIVAAVVWKVLEPLLASEPKPAG